jgi:hydrogenase maturation protein HypF
MTGHKIKSREESHRIQVTIRGAVQGVGFRPFIYRLATDLGLTGWVNNSSQGVFVEVEGEQEQLQIFLRRVEQDKPSHSLIQSMETVFLNPVGYPSFQIHQSDESGVKAAFILPDIATCSDCLREIFDPANRRYRYPFTNCTHCGPRFSIIEALPYDRPNTTMKHFEMCEQCRVEYENPLDRRFHAQPNACPKCGPHLELWDEKGNLLALHDEALLETASAIRGGRIVAVKGLGGFHLVADAWNESAIERLRQRKNREEKPFALMAPSVEWVRAHCQVSELESYLLTSSESPIVLLRRASHDGVASTVAPGNPDLGIMLPYTPFHHLLMAELDIPVVVTSGNLSDEPICTDEQDALTRLREIADLYLVHNRPIVHHADDSVVRVITDREQILRRARGYAPLPIQLKETVPAVLAVGSHLNNTIAASVGRQVFVSQHIGDLETTQAFDAFKRVITDFNHLYNLKPTMIACDAHPDYISTQFAQTAGLHVVHVQHHYAHVLACMAEHDLETSVLGISWDGTGYGLDGTVWGGEFLHVNETDFTRAAHLRTFPLPGGEQAVKQPRRAALGLLYEIFGDTAFDMQELAPIQAFSAQELSVLKMMLAKRINTPHTSSAGRLFDAVAATLSLRQQSSFEGQAAMDLEFVIDGVELDDFYNFEMQDYGEEKVVDWAPMVRGILDDLRADVSVRVISTKFHNTLAEIIAAVARRVGEERVVLTGGCFQNKYLTERAIHRLRSEGFRPFWHQQIPPNDGGIALGQVLAVSRMQVKE